MKAFIRSLLQQGCQPPSAVPGRDEGGQGCGKHHSGKGTADQRLWPGEPVCGLTRTGRPVWSGCTFSFLRLFLFGSGGETQGSCQLWTKSWPLGLSAAGLQLGFLSWPPRTVVQGLPLDTTVFSQNLLEINKKLKHVRVERASIFSCKQPHGDGSSASCEETRPSGSTTGDAPVAHLRFPHELAGLSQALLGTWIIC